MTQWVSHSVWRAAMLLGVTAWDSTTRAVAQAFRVKDIRSDGTRRLRLGMGLVLVVGLSPSAAIGGVEKLFEGCEISQREPARLFVKCDDFLASAYTAALAEESLLQASLNGLKAGFKGVVLAQSADVLVGGRHRLGRSVSLFARPGDEAPVAKGSMAVVPVEAAGNRVVSCVAFTAKAGSDQRCGPVLEALAVSLPEPTAPMATTSEYGSKGTAFAGRELSIPGGCELPQPGRITCASAVLEWRHVEGELRLDMVWEPLKTDLASQGSIRDEAKVGCSIAGARAECRSLKVKSEGDETFILVGVASSQGSGVLIQCTSTLSLRDGVPSPCNLVLSTR